MTNKKLLTDCQFCSVVSKAKGEDPIGTANTADTWLIMEISLPWTEKHLSSNPTLEKIHSLFHELKDPHPRIVPMAIAPDEEYSVPGYTRVFRYDRPAQSFAQFKKQEFLVPNSHFAQLVVVLLRQPDKLYQFEVYRQSNHDIRELMICTHGNVDVACSRFGYPIYRKLRRDYAPTSNRKLRVWRCSHFGGHQFAPTLFDLPTGHFWGHVEPMMLDTLVWRDSAVTQLRQFYRGWSGLTKFEQIVEREIWMQHGWEWLNYRKSGQLLAVDTANERLNADWAEVRIDFTSPNGDSKGSYEARVEVCNQIMTAFNSGREQCLQPVKQYRVSQLRRN